MSLEQNILTADDNFRELDNYLSEHAVKKIFLVHGNSMLKLDVWKYFANLQNRCGIEVASFKDFSPNPKYESVLRGIKKFRADRCDLIIAVGGGSPIDVAKCIKLYAHAEPLTEQSIPEKAPAKIPLLVMPTTAGSGSEATRYAVIYLNGEKQSVTSNDCLPNAILFDPSTLSTLPPYTKKSALLDAISHAIESYWSVNSSAESIACSKRALEIIFENADDYLLNEPKSFKKIMSATNLAGRAINITQTTAGHAMCYKLSTKYGIAHGHAAALCNAALFPYMINHVADCVDPRGQNYLEKIFMSIASAMNCQTLEQATSILPDLLSKWNLNFSAKVTDKELGELSASVHIPRLKNNPVALREKNLHELYEKILSGEFLKG